MKWEYLIIPTITIGNLNQLGSEEWELIMKCDSGYVFKRPERYKIYKVD